MESATQQTHPMAIASVVLGALGLIGILPLIGAIGAIITGRMAKNAIAEQPATYGGGQLARIGEILGWVGVALAACGLIAVIAIFALGLGGAILGEMSAALFLFA